MVVERSCMITCFAADCPYSVRFYHPYTITCTATYIITNIVRLYWLSGSFPQLDEFYADIGRTFIGVWRYNDFIIVKFCQIKLNTCITPHNCYEICEFLIPFGSDYLVKRHLKDVCRHHLRSGSQHPTRSHTVPYELLPLSRKMWLYHQCWPLPTPLACVVLY